MNALVPVGDMAISPDISARDNSVYSPAQETALDLKAALRTLTPHTQTAYTRHLAGFLAYCNDCGWALPVVKLLRPNVLQSWLAHLRQCGRAPATCKQAKAALCWAARQAKQAGELDASILADLRDVTVTGGGGVRQGRWYEAEEVKRLVRSLGGTSLRPVRDRALLVILTGCGLRRAELCDLTFANLDERDGQPVALVNLVGKRAKVRSVAIPEWARPYVAKWLTLYREQCDPGSDAPLVCEVAGGGTGTATARPLRPSSIYRISLQASTAAGLPEIAPHDLRRTAAKLMQQGGADILGIRDALGHASVATTERYLQTASGPAMATLAMDRLMR